MKQKIHIHHLAYVEQGAVLGKNVIVEPFAVVKKNVVLEDNVIVKSHAYIDGYTTIGSDTIIWPGACIGTKTQDKKFKGEKTFVSIGRNCEIREYVTINSSCGEGSTVEIGSNCLIMACSHVAHHCKVGHHVIMSNNCLLAGHVQIGDYAVLGGMTAVHQFSRIGCHAMVGGMSRVLRDIPPYTLGGGDPYKFGGINLVGLKRQGFSFEIRQALSRAFKYIYRSNLYLKEALIQIEENLPAFQEVLYWIEFCKHTKRGLLGLEKPGPQVNLKHEKVAIE